MSNPAKLPSHPVVTEIDIVPGDVVMITSGELEGIEARVGEVLPERNTAVVALLMFCRYPPFEIELSKLKKKPTWRSS